MGLILSRRRLYMAHGALYVAGGDPGEDITTGLVGHWTFDDGSGPTASDSSGSGNHGTLSGATWTTGHIGSGALSFDGEDDLVSIDSPTGLPNIDAEQTLSMWFKYSSLPPFKYAIITFRDTGGSAANQFSMNNSGTFLVSRWGGGEIHSTSAPSANEWHHVCWTTEGHETTGILYVDGAPADTDTTWQQSGTVGKIYFSTYDGQGVFDEPFAGELDDVRVYDRALTAEQVAALYSYGT